MTQIKRVKKWRVSISARESRKGNLIEPDNRTTFKQARSQGVRRTAQSAKRSTFTHKMGKKWGVCKRVKGDEVQKVHFWGPIQKVNILGVPHPPKIDPGYGPAFSKFILANKQLVNLNTEQLVTGAAFVT